MERYVSGEGDLKLKESGLVLDKGIEKISQPPFMRADRRSGERVVGEGAQATYVHTARIDAR